MTMTPLVYIMTMPSNENHVLNFAGMPRGIEVLFWGGQVWFQNRRMKHKRQTVSKDDPEMKETKSKSESGRTGRRTSKRYYDQKNVEICEKERQVTPVPTREYWMIYGGPGFLDVVWCGSSPTPLRQLDMFVFSAKLWRDIWGGGGVEIRMEIVLNFFSFKIF
jgi:hypothetical protein